MRSNSHTNYNFNRFVITSGGGSWLGQRDVWTPFFDFRKLTFIIFLNNNIYDTFCRVWIISLEYQEHAIRIRMHNCKHTIDFFCTVVCDTLDKYNLKFNSNDIFIILSHLISYAYGYDIIPIEVAQHPRTATVNYVMLYLLPCYTILCSQKTENIFRFSRKWGAALL